MNNKQLQEQFEKAYQKFKSKESQLSENVKWRLYYIVSRVYHTTEIKSIQMTEERELQIEQLKSLDIKSLMIMFKTIIKTLFFDKLVTNRKCKLRKNGFFTFWKDAFIQCDQQYLTINIEKHTTKYKLKSIRLANFRKSKKFFQIYHHSKLIYSIKFEKEDFFKNFYDKLSQEIAKFQITKKDIQKPSKELKSKKEEKNKPCMQSSYDISPIKKTYNCKTQNTFQQTKAQFLKQNKKISEEQEFQLSYPQKLYKEISRTQLMAISMNRQKPLIHIELLLLLDEPLVKIVQYYLLIKQWNSNIKQSKINKITNGDQNEFYFYRIYKFNSYFTSDRESYSKLVTNFVDEDEAEIKEKSCPGQKEVYTRCYIEHFTKFIKYKEGVKIIINFEFDGKGYADKKSSQDMLLKIFEDIKHFQDNYKINKLKSKGQETFDMEIPQTSILQTQDKKQNEKTKTSPSESPISSEENQFDKIKEKTQVSKFIQEKMVKPLQIPSNNYIQMIKSRQQERYYLSQKFDFDFLQKYDDYKPDYTLDHLIKRGEYIINSNKEPIFINESLLQGQKDVLKFIIRQIGVNLISGKSVLNVSMPVDIFEGKSLIERNASAFGKIPDLLCPVAEADCFSQIKKVVALIASITQMQLVQLKPFNPILGQTFQGYIKGIPIYYQQISHHPPISYYYMKCQEFFLYGYLQAFADVSINSAVGGNNGKMNIVFKNGSHFIGYFPPCLLSGLIFGERKFRPYGKGYVVEKNKKIFAQFSFQKTKKVYNVKEGQKFTAGDIVGGIYRTTNEFIEKVNSIKLIKKFEGINKQDIIQTISSIRGIWFEDMFVDNQIINQGINTYPVEYPSVSLPSDSNYRLDVLYHRQNNLPESQQQKQIYEVIQRADRKLRQKGQSRRKKK